MPTVTLPLWLVRQDFPSNTCLWEALLEPEHAILTGKDHSPDAVLARLKQVLEGLPEDQLARRFMVENPHLQTQTVAIEPPPRSVLWHEPLALPFHVAVWEHPAGNWIGYLPALRQYVVRSKRETLEAALQSEILRALEWRQWLHDLEQLTQLALVSNVALEPHTITLNRVSPLQRIKQRRDREEASRSVLRDCVTERPIGSLPRALGRDAEAARLARLVTGRFSRPVLLVGPRGVGKTALLYEALVRAAPLPGPFWETDGLRLVAGMSGYGMWQERCQEVVRQARRAMAALHLGGLAELANAGLSVANDQGIGEWFAAAIPREGLLAFAECTAEQFSALERRVPQLVQVFERFDVEVPDETTVLAILQHAAGLRFTSGGLLEVLRLHARFATESAAPGRPLRFVHDLLHETREDPVSEGDVIGAFSRETGIPPAILDDSIALHALELRRDLSRQVIGQEEAVNVVVDVISRIKARLQRPGKPLATLLFTGPTGVGKTELTKAMARFFFSDERRMVRIDMSEYAHPAQARRLFGASGEREGVLTARIRENPFSLVLLDEFEKAHPAVFDLLLQVCGEGRLTDEAGRLADFRNAVIVLTSNLGAASYLKPAAGFGLSGADTAEGTRLAAEHFASEARRFLRPEMFNRLDAIVPFRPLTADVSRQIVRREVERINHRRGLIERRARLALTEQAIDRVIEIGMDLRYGARPLKRVLDARVLVPLAEMMNADGAVAGQSIEVSANTEKGLSLVRTKDAATSIESPGAAQAMTSPTETRRRLGSLFRNDKFGELLVEYQQLKRRTEQLDQDRKRGKEAGVLLRKFAVLDTLVRQAHQLREEVARHEDELVQAVVEEAKGPSPSLGYDYIVEAQKLAKRLQELLRALEGREDEAPHRATWLAFCADPSHLHKVLGPQLLSAISVLFEQSPTVATRILRLGYRPIPDDERHRHLRRVRDPLALLKAGIVIATEVNERDAAFVAEGANPSNADWAGIGIRVQAPNAWRLLRGACAAFEVVVNQERTSGQLTVLRGHPELSGQKFDESALLFGQPGLPSWIFDRNENTFRPDSVQGREAGRNLGAWIAGELRTIYQRLLWSWMS